MLFTPLSGDAQSSITTPLAYILQIDDVRILLDCGSPDWRPEDEGTSEERWEGYCRALESQAPSIDLVLLSHGDLAHVGLYAYAHARWGLRAPTYASLPVQAMGKMAVTEEVESLRAEESIEQDIGQEEVKDDEERDFAREAEAKAEREKQKRGKRIATLKEVQAAFDSLTTLRYSQPIHLSGKCQGLTITPFSSGHTLGGTIWKIRSPSSGTILYAVNMNHMKERHIDGTILAKGATGGSVFEPLARPDLLITDAERTLIVSPRRKDRDAALLDTITSTLKSGHSLLLPCDASTRVLELLVLLDQHWSYSKLRAPICLMSRTGGEMIALVRSMMEWLGGTVSKDEGAEGGERSHGGKRKRGDEDDEVGTLSLKFRHLELFPSPAALLHTYPSSKPKLILAVPTSLSHSSSRSLFADFASVPGNVVVLTTRPEPGTLGGILFDTWNEAQPADSEYGKGKMGRVIEGKDEMISVKIKSKVPLAGAELEAHLAQERATKERETAHKAALARSQRMLEADEEESDSEASDSEDDEANIDKALAVKDSAGLGEGGMDWSLLDSDDIQPRTQQLSFDIFLKGNVSKATSFFKPVAGSAGNQGGLVRFRMFPYVERKRKVDAYGETIDVANWLRKGKVLEEEGESEEVREAKRKKAEEEEAKKLAAAEPPSKFIVEQVDVRISCRLFYVDMEGLNDGRAVKTLVPQVNPRKMIIVHASHEASSALVESCGTIRSMTKDIFAPSSGESITIGQQTNTFTISLSDELMASVKMSRFEDNEVGYVSGVVASHSSSTIPILLPSPSSPSSKKAITSAPRLGASPIIGRSTPIPLPRSTMIGDLKLTSLKTRLTSRGISAEFVGDGVLMCGGQVAVQKTGRGQVLIEGSISSPNDVYYTVREEIYGLHAHVAA